MVPVHTAPAFESPYVIEAPEGAEARVLREGREVGRVRFPGRPRFYDLTTADGVPYHKIAVLHGRDVLATTVLQTCIRYESRRKTCQFCAIGQSLAAGRTIAHKTPAQLAEVAKAAVELDGVKHMVLTTGTPKGADRGAAVLADSARAIKAAVALPVQAQCEPPEDDAWHGRMRDAGVDALGMHLEAVTPEVRARIMPGKAGVPVEKYFASFEAAVRVFGRGRSRPTSSPGSATRPSDPRHIGAADGARRLSFVVPFVPISHPAREPSGAQLRLHGLHPPALSRMVAAGMRSEDIKAGCGKCGACSALSTYEKLRVA